MKITITHCVLLLATQQNYFKMMTNKLYFSLEISFGNCGQKKFDSESRNNRHQKIFKGGVYRNSLDGRPSSLASFFFSGTTICIP